MMTVKKCLLAIAATICVLCAPLRSLDAQKRLPPDLRPRMDDAEDMAWCPQYIGFTFASNVTGLIYTGWAPRGADGIGKVWYGVNGVTDATSTMAAYGRFSVYGWMCRVVGTANMLGEIWAIPASNVEVSERPITPIDLACGGGSTPDANGDDFNRAIPVRFTCGGTGTSGGGDGSTAYVTIVTVTSCDYDAVFDGSGGWLYNELKGCRQTTYLA